MECRCRSKGRGATALAVSVALLWLVIGPLPALGNPEPLSVMFETDAFRNAAPDSAYWEPEIVLDSFAICDSVRFFVYGREHRHVEVSLIPGCAVLVNGEPWIWEFLRDNVVMSYEEWVENVDDWQLVPDSVAYAVRLMEKGLTEREAGLQLEYERWRLVRSIENCYVEARLQGLSPVEAGELARGRVRELDTCGLVDYRRPITYSDSDITFEWICGGLWVEHIPLHTGNGTTPMLSYDDWYHRDIYPLSRHITGARGRTAAERLRERLVDSPHVGYLAVERNLTSTSGARPADVALIDAQVQRSRESGGYHDGPLPEEVVAAILAADAEQTAESH